MAQTNATNQAGETIGRSRYSRILLITCLSFLVNALDRGNISVAAPAIAQEMGLAAMGLGIVFSAFLWGYVPMQIPGGLAGQRFGAKRVVVICMVAWSAATFLTGLATDVGQLITFRVLLGFAEGAAFPTYAFLLSRWFPKEERGQANSLLFFGGIAGGFIGSPLTGFLIAASGWHTMFFLETIPPLVVAAAFAIWVADDPRTDRRLGEGERQWILSRFEAEEAEKTAAATVSTGAEQPVRWHQALRNRRLWAAALLYSAPSFAGYGLFFFLPTVIAEVAKVGIASVGVLAAIPTLVGLGLLLANGRLSDTFHRRDLFGIWPAVVVGIGLLIAPTIDDTIVKLVVIGLATAAASAGAGVNYAFAMDVTPPAHRGLASGFTNTFTQTAGLIAPLAIGFIAGAGPAINGIWILGVVSLVGVSIAILLLLVSRPSVSPAVVPQRAG